MTAPPGTIPFGAFGTDIEQLFEQAFSAAPGSRPTALQWVAALRRLESSLVVCRAEVTHHHPDEAACCWCAYEKRWNTRIFGRQLNQYVAAGVPKVARLWDAITAIKKPDPAEPLEMPPPNRGESSAEQFGRKLAGVFKGADWHTWQEELNRAHEQVRRRVEKWNLATVRDEFGDLYRDLERVKERLLELPRERARRIEALSLNLEALQLDAWLSKFAIDQARILKLNAYDVALLASYGIDSADDVIRNIGNLPVFMHPEAAGNVRAWARSLQREFRFDPSRGLEPAQVQQIDDELAAEQEKLMGTLAKGASKLRGIVIAEEDERTQLRNELNDARSRLLTLERNNMRP